jgi:hypothetical protein
MEITTTTSTLASYNWHDTSMCVCVREREVFTNKLHLFSMKKCGSVSDDVRGKKAMSRGHKKAIEVKGRRTYVQKKQTDGWMDERFRRCGVETEKRRLFENERSKSRTTLLRSAELCDDVAGVGREQIDRIGVLAKVKHGAG